MRTSLLLLFCISQVLGQKKIVVATGSESLARELQSVTPKVHVVLLTPANRAQELADADAYIGDIPPADVRAGKSSSGSR